MRYTYSMLLQAAQDYAIDGTTTSSTNLSNSRTFLSREINATVQHLFQLTRDYKSIPLPKTMSTVANQVYYHNPVGLLSIESVTLPVGSIDYPLKVVNSQAQWDLLQRSTAGSTGIPEYYFPRQYDIGLFPTPSAVHTVTLVGNYLPSRLSVIDYTAETIATSQNSATVTGTSTVFTAAMVGRWLVETDSDGIPVGNFYKIKTFTSTTSLALETVFAESSLSGATYLVGQSPEIAEELHEYIPYRAAATYYRTVRRDPAQAQILMNYYYTGDEGNTRRGGGVKGGVLGVINRYKNLGRSNSQLVEMNQQRYNQWPDDRSTTLSGVA